MKRVHLLGVPIDVVVLDEAVSYIRSLLEGDEQHHVMTPNSEMLVEASHNRHFHEILLQSSLNLPDSAGLLWAARDTRQDLPQRVAGIDAVEELCRGLDAACPVFFLGGRAGTGARAAAELKIRNFRLSIAGTYEGSPDPKESSLILSEINAKKPRLLLVAYGAPAQDLWIAEHLSHMPSVRVAIGVGGTFDFLSGKQKRAPVWMQKNGIEWAWRFLREPWRIKRIWNAVVVFPLLILLHGKRAPHPSS